MTKLAIYGGKQVINKKVKPHNSISKEEKKIVDQVVSSGKLSEFFGVWGKGFYGGKYVKKFEKDCEKFFKVKYAIAVNSWTSGLICSVGALDISPGDEIIVPTWTMSACATSILVWNAIPVFADISYETYNLDPFDVEKKITKKTKAIMAVDIFGHSAPIKELKIIAKKYKLKIISDSAQSPGAKYGKNYAGTLTDIGGISLNYHKHINTGEGGVIFTNSKYYAERMRLIRNHAESVVANKKVNNYRNLIGFNFRMGEIEAAIGIEQLKKLKKIIKNKQTIAKILSNTLGKLKGIKLQKTQKNCTHVYYIFPMQVDSKKLGVHRDKIYKALLAEGIQGLQTKFTNVHRLPMFRKKIAYGKPKYPWNVNKNSKVYNYRCPVAEDLLDNKYIGILLCSYDFKKADALKIIKAFKKVWKNIDYLR